MSEPRRTLRGRVALWCTVSAAISLITFACVTYVVVLLQELSEAKTGVQPTPQDEARNRALVALAVAAPIGLSLAVVGSRWLAKRALAPIDDVVRTATDMSAEKLDRRLDLPLRDDELRALVVALNGLFARLETGFAALSSYAADASHELRTPLTVIATELEVALRRPRTPGEWEASARTALDEARRLSRLVESLLALASSSPPGATEVDVGKLVDEAVSAAAPRAEAAGVSLRASADGPAAITRGV
jgi:signal transduction histidine kinase